MNTRYAPRGAGIEAINAYMGSTFMDVRTLFERRGLNLERFPNLMMNQKSVALPCEDPVTNAVNAAKPIVDALSPEERDRIEWVITGTESGLDFGKSLATYVHDVLGLSKSCRVFETKQACFAATATLQLAANSAASGVSPGSKALIIATDVAQWRAGLAEDDFAGGDNSYAEPSMGTGAVAMLVSDNPKVMALDLGASGMHSYEVCDTCRPVVGVETGNADLSLLSYMDCAKGAFEDYQRKVEGADFQDTFDYLAFHTPFGGLVRSVHRKLMRQHKRARLAEIEADFDRRVQGSLEFCTRVGNIYSATAYLGLCGLISQAEAGRAHRVGVFSYGSGCASEFYSGVIAADAAERMAALDLAGALEARRELSFDEYEQLLELNASWGFGIRDREVDLAPYQALYDDAYRGRGLLRLKAVKGFHREYDWS